MVTAVLDRLPDYVTDPAGTVHHDTVGVINGTKKLPAAFTPGRRFGAARRKRWTGCRRSSTPSVSLSQSPVRANSHGHRG